ncbi:MAG: HpcH/HpaI aldolase/citrate lyase family protein [Alphaproteobacteria bacterium]
MAFENKLKKKLLAREPALGCWLSSGSSVAAEVVAHAGYDAVVLDHEHGPGDLMNAITLMQAVGEVGAPSLMRVPWNDMVYIKRALDIGILGILVPYVQTAKEAKAAVDACIYPTKGIRGVAPHAARCTRWGAKLDDYMAALPDLILTMVQIETAQGVENIEEIAAVDGLDMLFLGPGDLAASIGLIGQVNHPDAVALIEKAEAKMRKTGKLMGTVTRPGKTVNWTFDQGYDFVIAGQDIKLLQQAATAQVAAFRADPPKPAGRRASK